MAAIENSGTLDPTQLREMPSARKDYMTDKLHALLSAIPTQPQREDCTFNQVKDLWAIASHFGLYDAVNVIKTILTDSAVNKKFLSVIDAGTRDEILCAVAKHYDMTKEEALRELTCDGAEPLLDSLPDAIRQSVEVLMNEYSLAFPSN